MDINCDNFNSQLPLILRAVSRSRFVSFDLELSGIPSKQRSRGTNVVQYDGGRQTLQQRYTETKAAAERFQILQLGLTCVEEDLDRGKQYLMDSSITVDDSQGSMSYVPTTSFSIQCQIEG